MMDEFYFHTRFYKSSGIFKCEITGGKKDFVN